MLPFLTELWSAEPEEVSDGLFLAGMFLERVRIESRGRRCDPVDFAWPPEVADATIDADSADQVISELMRFARQRSTHPALQSVFWALSKWGSPSLINWLTAELDSMMERGAEIGIVHQCLIALRNCGADVLPKGPPTLLDAMGPNRHIALAYLARWRGLPDASRGVEATHEQQAEPMGMVAAPNAAPDAASHRDLQAGTRRQSLYFPADMLEEIKSEAQRQDRSLSWLVQRAWEIASPHIKSVGDKPRAVESEKPE